MKKSTRKLVLHHETLRVLGSLHLVEARGGDAEAAPRIESTATCPAKQAPEPPG